MIAALPTKYRGIQFRSKLEARWAVFFDALGIKWEYEPQGFSTSEGNYLPDFFLEGIGWAEIKSTLPSDESVIKKLEDVGVFTNQNAYFLNGFLDREESLICAGHECLCVALVRPNGKAEAGWDDAHFFCECKKCGKIGIEFEGRAERLSCKCFSGDKGRNYDSPRILRALNAARVMLADRSGVVHFDGRTLQNG